MNHIVQIAFVSPNGLYRNQDYKSEKQVGATEQQILGVGQVLTANGHDVSILRPWDENSHENIGPFHIENISLPKKIRKGEFSDNIGPTELPFVFTSDVYYCKGVHNRLKKINPDLVLTTDISTTFLLRNLDSPQIYWVHSGISTIDFKSKYSPVSKLKKWALTQYERVGNYILPLTKSMESKLTTNGFQPLSPIPNAISPEDYPSNGYNNTILYGGRLVGVKNVSDLINAFVNSESSDNCNLLIIGSGPKESGLKRMAREKKTNAISFSPILPRKEFIEQLSKCRAFVLPTKHETFGTTIIESMACERQVISTRVPGPRDIIKHRKTGFLYDQGDVGELSKLIDHVVNNTDPKKIGKQARKEAEQKYSFTAIGQKHSQLAKRIINNE